jgi:cysteine desulfurase
MVNRKYRIIKLSISSSGIINIPKFTEILNENKLRTALVSIMNVNNETGVIQPIEELCIITKNVNQNIIFHSDVSHGLIPLHDQKNHLPDIVSFSGYKIGGPHIGIVLSKNELQYDYLGTPDVFGIVIFGKIFDNYMNKCIRDDYRNKIKTIKSIIKYKMDWMSNLLNMNFLDISNYYSIDNIQSYLLPPEYEAKIIQSRLSEYDIFIGTGSACSSQNKKGSHVINALGFVQYSHSLIRFSYDDQITEEMIDNMIIHLKQIITNLKLIVSPNTKDKPKIRNPTILEKLPLSNDLSYEILNKSLNIKLNLNTNLNGLKLSVAELYLKGKNKNIYFQKLLKTIKSEYIAKENVIIIKKYNEIEIPEYKRIPGLSTVAPCYLIKRDKDDDNEIISFICNNLFEKSKFRLTVKYINVKYNRNT